MMSMCVDRFYRGKGQGKGLKGHVPVGHLAVFHSEYRLKQDMPCGGVLFRVAIGTVATDEVPLHRTENRDIRGVAGGQGTGGVQDAQLPGRSHGTKRDELWQADPRAWYLARCMARLKAVGRRCILSFVTSVAGILGRKPSRMAASASGEAEVRLGVGRLWLPG